MELRPRMLKDCLLEDSNSCSSNEFKSIPRRPPCTPFPKKRKQSNPLQAVINAVKNLKSVKSRSLSRQTSSKNEVKSQESSIITVVRVKDIVRWNSSKDLHDDEKDDRSHLPHQYIAKTTTTTTTTTGSTTTTTSAATSCSSWCESEFLQSSWGSNVEEECSEKESGKKNLLISVSEDSCTAITVADTQVGPEEDLQSEKEQNSPVSVFEIQHEEDDEEVSDSSFSQCLDNVERTKEKLMETIQRFENLANLDEWVSMDEESCTEGDCDTVIDKKIDDEDGDEVEEKAMQLWNQVKERHAIWIHEEHLIMDYFRDELTNSFQDETYRDHQGFEKQVVGEAKGWLQGQRVYELESGTGEQRREACAREIERRDWNEKRMKEECQEVAVEIEDGIFSVLMNETLTALYQC